MNKKLKGRPKAYDEEPLVFAVGSPTDPRSSVWRLWVQGDDVYFGTRNSLNVVKTSLHKSGDWRIAYVKRLKDSDKNSDRIIKRWTRPLAYQNGIVSCVSVLVSSIRPRTPLKSLTIDDPRIIWLTPPAAHRVIILFVMIAEKEQDTDPARFPEDRLVGRRKKANGETICLIAHQRDLTDDITKLIVDAVSKLIIHTDNKESILISSLLITSHDDQIGPTNPPTILDIETGMENIKFSYK